MLTLNGVVSMDLRLPSRVWLTPTSLGLFPPERLWTQAAVLRKEATGLVVLSEWPGEVLWHTGQLDTLWA